MSETLYLLAIAKGSVNEVASCLGCNDKPTHVRLATRSELSNWGFPSGADAWLLGVNNNGAIVGSPEYPEVPHILVPWSNINYLADGTALAQADQTKGKKKK